MNFRTILILGALSAFGPLAIDFYLPAFPAMALAFGTDEQHVQLTLAAYFLGLSIGQLMYGPVADRFGRRIPLLTGVGLFTVAPWRAPMRRTWNGCSVRGSSRRWAVVRGW